MSADREEGVSSREALRVWARVAVQSFGGPAGQISVIHRIVVDEKRWLSEDRFLHALSYCMLLPGPEAQQLATYIGWLLRGVRGGLVAGGLFILPGFLSIMALSVLYAEYRELGVVAGLFLGLKPAVMAVVFEALLRLKRRALKGRFDILLAGLAFVAIFFFQIPFPIIIIGAAVAGVLGRSAVGESFRTHGAHPDVAAQRPSLRTAGWTALCWLAIWSVPFVILFVAVDPQHVFVLEAVFFSKAAVVTFGGAYAVLSYVAQQVVETYQWLAPGEMLDGLGMAETTPGPLIQVVQFVGFMGAYRHSVGLDPLMAGVIGAIVTTWVTFAPCFLFIFVGAPFVEYLREKRALNAALRGITAAVVGVVLNLGIWFALHTLFGDLESRDVGPARVLVPTFGSLNWTAVFIGTGAVLALFKWKWGMMRTLVGAAIAGVVLNLAF